MTRIFVSYSRTNKSKVKRIVEYLKRAYDPETVWWDENFYGGQVWWKEITDRISWADVFIYVMSERSLSSPYCLAELEEARRVHQRILPIKLERGIRVPDALARLNWIDLSGGLSNNALLELVRAINKLTQTPRSDLPPLLPEPVSLPNITERRGGESLGRQVLVGIIVTVIGGLFLALMLALLNNFSLDANGTNAGGGSAALNAVQLLETAHALQTAEAQTQTAQAAAFASLTAAARVAATGEAVAQATLRRLSATPTASATPTLTSPPATRTMPTISADQQSTLIAATTQAMGLLGATTAAQTATTASTSASMGLVAIVTSASNVNVRTNPSADSAIITSVIPGARLAVVGFNSARDWVRVRLANGMEGWISTALVQLVTPTSTPTVPVPPTPIPTQSADAAILSDPAVQAAWERASSFVFTNADWTPFAYEIYGITLMLVPAGCFDRVISETQTREECFDQPFWIGRDEVTNAQFRRFVDDDGYAAGSTYWQGVRWRTENNIEQPAFWNDSNFNRDDQPVVGVSFYEIDAYIRWLNAQTGLRWAQMDEAQWQYAARGPDGWLYPWGNEFRAENVVFADNANGRPAPVGSRPGGASWVGARDMSGNVWERSNTYLLLGGAFDVAPDLLNALTRTAVDPTLRTQTTGFRLGLLLRLP